MILQRIVTRILICLLLTIVLEAGTALIVGVRTAYGQLIVFLTNLATNPLLNCILTVVSFYISPSAYYYFLVPLELVVVVAEGLIFRHTLRLKMHPFLFSFLLNAVSYCLGTGILKIIN